MFPIENTVANLNLEQLGRTDDTEGPRVAAAILTGFGFSEIRRDSWPGDAQARASSWKTCEEGDQFFESSDNPPLAAVGVPAHTMAVAFMFPDYHQPGDEWQNGLRQHGEVTRAVDRRSAGARESYRARRAG